MVATVFTLAPIISKLSTIQNIQFVGGAADFALAAEQSSFQKAAFVLPLSEQSSPNQLSVMQVRQRVAASFRVVILIRNYSDATGAAAIDQDLNTMRSDILTALLGFVPSSNWDMIEHQSGSLLKAENGAIWWQDDFNTAFYRSSL